MYFKEKVFGDVRATDQHFCVPCVTVALRQNTVCALSRVCAFMVECLQNKIDTKELTYISQIILTSSSQTRSQRIHRLRFPKYYYTGLYRKYSLHQRFCTRKLLRREMLPTPESYSMIAAVTIERTITPISYRLSWN